MRVVGATYLPLAKAHRFSKAAALQTGEKQQFHAF
jgi:hypothetical protein